MTDADLGGATISRPMCERVVRYNDPNTLDTRVLTSVPRFAARKRGGASETSPVVREMHPSNGADKDIIRRLLKEVAKVTQPRRRRLAAGCAAIFSAALTTVRNGSDRFAASSTADSQ
jgi:hypothetical protein